MTSHWLSYGRLTLLELSLAEEEFFLPLAEVVMWWEMQRTSGPVGVSSAC